MKRPRANLILPSLLLIGLPALVTRAEVIERVIVRVNADIVTQSEFEQRQITAVQLARVPGEQIERYLRENNARILQEAIDDLLLVQRAAQLGLKVPPAYLAEVIEGIKKDNNLASDDELAQQLRREGMSIDDLRRNIERQVLRREVLRRELESRTTVTEAEARAEYERRRGDFVRPASLTLQEIVVEGAGEAARTKAEQLAQRARGGEDFAALAREHSTAATASGGGSLGELRRDELSSELARVVEALPVGGVSEPLPVEKGYRLIKVVTRSEAGQVPFEQAKADLVRALSQQRMASAYEGYVEGLRKSALIDLKVREVPLQVSVPTETLLEPTLPPAAGAATPPVPGPASPVRPDEEFSVTTHSAGEKVAPPPASGAAAASPAPPSPSPSPTPPAP